jgi:branched-chain amino acid transport system permease protein
VRIVALAVLGAAALALPLLGDNYLLRLATIFMMYAALALSWSFIGGLAGYPSFATAAFFGLGAYAGAIIQARGVPVYLAWACAGGVAALFAAALGGVILRLRGHYFAIASLVVAGVLSETATSWTDLTGGGTGFNLPIMQSSVAEQARFFYYAMLALALLALVAFAWVKHGRLGFGLRCIQQNENAANMVGVDATLYKTAAFALSAVFVGAAGAIYASWVFYIEPPDVFDVLLSIKPIIMVLIGGLGTIAGPVLGAAVFLVLEELLWRNFLTTHAGILGVMVVLLVFFLPNGILALGLPGLVRRRGGTR